MLYEFYNGSKLKLINSKNCEAVLNNFVNVSDF